MLIVLNDSERTINHKKLEVFLSFFISPESKVSYYTVFFCFYCESYFIDC